MIMIAHDRQIKCLQKSHLKFTRSTSSMGSSFQKFNGHFSSGYDFLLSFVGVLSSPNPGFVPVSPSHQNLVPKQGCRIADRPL